MFKIAEMQTLYVEKTVEYGAYLVEEENKDLPVPSKDQHVLLPKKQVPEDVKRGQAIDVFIYRDSDDRLIATTTVPKVTLHKVSRLIVSDVGKVGAFLDWGLEKDLLLPYAEQTRRVSKGDEVLVAAYLDKSNRIAATMNVYPYLETASGYLKDSQVTGTVYETSDNFGAFVAVDDKYQGLIPKKELYGNVSIGDVVSARVTRVREDGKLDLSIREKAYKQIESDALALVDIIKSYNGVLPFSEKADAEVIKRETGMSKNQFKKAVGNLYKNRIIEITDESKIRLL
ncbi:MAG: S1-like domain-containing RNA-binding protein [Lachnospiraceae bacterium]|nr:S1-like domain-containing RNA-binding protein [Lachnospiraceae bacterium]